MKKTRRGVVQKRMNKYREMHSICENCGVMLSVLTHHIKPVGMGGAPPESQLHQEGNFVALCNDCHTRAHTDIKKSKILFQAMKHEESGTVWQYLNERTP